VNFEIKSAKRTYVLAGLSKLGDLLDVLLLLTLNLGAFTLDLASGSFKESLVFLHLLYMSVSPSAASYP
jgi:hypothetical protein